MFNFNWHVGVTNLGEDDAMIMRGDMIEIIIQVKDYQTLLPPFVKSRSNHFEIRKLVGIVYLKSLGAYNPLSFLHLNILLYPLL